jgi:hypothetical protein
MRGAPAAPPPLGFALRHSGGVSGSGSGRRRRRGRRRRGQQRARSGPGPGGRAPPRVSGELRPKTRADGAGTVRARASPAANGPRLPPPSRTNWTRLVHPSVLTGHVSPAANGARRALEPPGDDPVAHGRLKPPDDLSLPETIPTACHGRRYQPSALPSRTRRGDTSPRPRARGIENGDYITTSPIPGIGHKPPAARASRRPRAGRRARASSPSNPRNATPRRALWAHPAALQLHFIVEGEAGGNPWQPAAGAAAAAAEGCVATRGVSD